MSQIALQFTATDFATLDPALRTQHARFLAKYKDALVTFGPIAHADGSPAGYAYQADFPGTGAEGIQPFLAEDPFAKARLYRSATVTGWRCALPHRQTTTPMRSGFQGFFFHGIAKSNTTERRNALVDAHRAHLASTDNTNCLARGGLTDQEGKAWFGSAMVYEFPDRRAFDELFAKEPFVNGDIYERVEIYNWRRGEMAA